MSFYNQHKKIITSLLVILLLLPFFLFLVTPAAQAVNLDWAEKYPWLKGVLLLLVSLVINNFTNKNIDRDNSKPDIRVDNPVIIENHLNNTDKEVLGFHVNWLSPDSDSSQALKENWRNIDMLAPFWYTVNPDGEIETRYGGFQYDIDSFSRNHNIKVLPLINNNQENNMILVNPEVRKKAVNNIVELVDKYDYAGVNIDFEFLPSWTRNGYTTFIKELSTKLRKVNKIITISVFPKIDVPLDLQGAYDYADLAPLVDRVVIMTYDNHWSNGPAGPIAPIDWVEDNILYALEYFPSEKILLGIANYGYDWSGGYGQDLGSRKAMNLAAENKAKINWHEKYQTPYFYYWDGDKKHEVWFENSNSLAFKLDLVNKYNLKGIGIWRLGNATDKFWETINTKLKS